MAGKARNFSRIAVAAAATCLLGVTVMVPAAASEEMPRSDSLSSGISSTAVAEGQQTTAAPMVVPEEPGQTLEADADTGTATETDTEDGTDVDSPNEGETSADGDSSGSDSLGEADADGSGTSDGTDSGDGSLDAEAGTGDVDSDGDSSGTVPPATEEPIEPPTGTELPTEPIEPEPEAPGPTMVPEEPGKIEYPHTSPNDQSGEPTLDTSIQPDSENQDGLADNDAVKANTEALAATGANELMLVIGIGALLVIGGLVLVVLRLRKRDN